ncbi:hypothetical protein TRFO_29294 [Tritrichomonas foetus]|uniref:Anaphase-promoting complex subunit 4-like WD40 domain-containing protein n=1 Tax=Tritrichomonas foetus TaxID=1144522 RepID=A0A1J4K0Q4_9EUKA|nr:hypothetical protein TRFO_29294 [Tritrichomonas foetus]|eukprot:OHT03318.1 hypothetical protein TRFO_29294 [Tritrichomonas foetus]
MVNIANQLIPHFPPEYIPQNSKAIDFCDEFVACATGFCVHFAYLKGNQLTRAYSFPISTYPITSLRFHQKTHRLAVGNSIGTVYLFDVNKRAIIARAASNSRDDDCVLCLQWHHDELFALYQNQKLISYTFSPTFSDASKQLSHFVCLWSTSLPASHSRMSIDPHNSDKILFSGSSATFSVFKLSETGGPPSPLLRLVTLNGAGNINDAVWSLHLPNYIFLLTDTELFIFDSSNQGITSMTQHQRSASSFSSLLQFATNDKRLLILHKSGSISVLNVQVPPYLITFNGEVNYKHRNQTYVNFSKDYGNDDFVILWFAPLGLCVYDANRKRVVSMCPLFTSGITSFDTDGISIVYGTKSGNVIYCDLFDTDRANVFSVSEDTVTFVNLCPARNRIYWHTPSRIGVVDLSLRQIQIFSSRASPVTKAIGSFQGCLIVQRAPSVLGIYINDKEQPILLNNAAIDFCFNEGNASFDEGEFAILHENKEILFYKYSGTKVTPVFRLQKAFAASQSPSCVAWYDKTVVIGTQEGTVYSYNISRVHGKRKITLVASTTQNSPIVKLSVTEQNNNVFGLTSDNRLFMNIKDSLICPKKVVQFYPVSSELVLTLSPSGYLQFLTSPKFSQLSTQSKILPLPSPKFFLTEKLKDPTSEPYFSLDARDAWLILRNQTPLRLKAAAAASPDSKIFEEIVYELLNHSNLDPSNKMELLFPSLLYANRFTEASDALLAVDVNEKRYLYCILLASLAIGFDKKIGEKQKTRLKMSALALFTSEKYEDGAMLLRLARLDKAAVDYLLESQQLNIAMRFVRSSLEDEEKREMMIRCGGFLLQKGNMKQAVPFFAGCGEFHPLLFVLFSMQEIADCFFIKRYAEKNGLLKPLNENITKAVGTIMPLDELCHVIDAEFKSLLYHNDIDVNLYFTE